MLGKDKEEAFDIIVPDDNNKPIVSNERRTRPVLSRFERARILAIRAEQIGRGATALVDRFDNSNPLQLAEREFGAGLIPFIIRRYLQDGTRYFLERCFIFFFK